LLLREKMEKFNPKVIAIKRYFEQERFKNIIRPYTAEEVYKVRGSVFTAYSRAESGANKLWNMMQTDYFIRALGALTGHQAVQMVRAGLKAIYCSGWQVAGDANTNEQTYPDQSLYAVDSMPTLVRRINNALLRMDEIEHAVDKNSIDWMVPLVADAESGFGGILNVFELMKAIITAGAAAVHFEDQLSSEKKCGHMGGKVVIPTSEFVKKLIGARFAADVLGVPTILIARTDALSAKLLANDIDSQDERFIVGKRNSAGFYRFNGSLDAAIIRGLTYAPFADMLWCETSKPDLGEAREFANAIHNLYPNKLLAYNCSPSFNWRKHLDDITIARFQDELASMGYRFQFITLAGFHVLNYYTYDLARNYGQRGMSAFVDLQQKEFDAEKDGYTAIRHQEEVGAGYFDQVQMAITGEDTETTALKDSTEKEQF
jgi:isocitrate lyase